MHKAFILSIIPFLFGCDTSEPANEKMRPNILLILADDLGYSDLGAYGGEISTSNIDQLAKEGLSFSQFHTGPMCAVSRSMLLTGNDNHIAGMGCQDLKTNEFGYEGYLTERIATIPQVLKEAGYFTTMVGKWHLGNQPEHYPIKKGFDKSFALLEGGGNHYSAEGIFPDEPISSYVENEKKGTWKEGEFSTNFYTSKLIEYLKGSNHDEKPFFAFASYTAPHWPLQVDSSYWMKYQGMYDSGYEALKNRRFENLKTLGFIPSESVLPEPHPLVQPWDSLSADQQMVEARKMELYAGMVDNLDENVGRLIEYLKESGTYENTMIVFLSDNGAAGNDFYNHPYFSEFLQANYTDAYEQMGTKESFISYGPQWAEAGAAPFKYFKGYTTQGGINNPLIISGAGVTQENKITEAFASIMDLAPTFYDLAETQYPASYDGNKLYPLKGETITQLLKNESKVVHQEDYVFVLEHREYAMVRKGDWKITNIIKPFDVTNFKLYNIKLDLGEQNNLRLEEPEIFQDLIKEWSKYLDETKAQFPTPTQLDQ